MNKIPVWIDSDAGVDDAYALVSALKLDNLDVVGISAVSGNVELSKTYKNIRNVISLCKREDIKVYKGADKPLIVKPHYAYYVHGEDGLGGIEIKESKASHEELNAYDALYKKAKELNGELTLVAIGPLTNIAIAIYKYPDIVNYIKEILIMGGSIGVGGNTTIAAEFNIYADPHAAQTVFKSGMKITLFPLDVTMNTYLNRDELELIKDFNNEVADFLYKASVVPTNLYKSLNLGDVLCLHDTCPFLYLNNPNLFKGKMAGVYVETLSEIELGRTVSDLYVKRDELFEKNTLVILESNRDEVAKLVLETFKGF